MYDYEDRITFYAQRLREYCNDHDIMEADVEEVMRYVGQGHPTEDILLREQEREDELE